MLCVVPWPVRRKPPDDVKHDNNSCMDVVHKSMCVDPEKVSQGSISMSCLMHKRVNTGSEFRVVHVYFRKNQLYDIPLFNHSIALIKQKHSKRKKKSLFHRNDYDLWSIVLGTFVLWTRIEKHIFDLLFPVARWISGNNVWGIPRSRDTFIHTSIHQ